MFRSLKTKITLVIALTLLICVSAYLFVGITLSGKVYREQAENQSDVVIALSVSKVDQYTNLMEKKVTELALVGELFHEMQRAATGTDARLGVEEHLLKSLSTFKEAIGGGIWYEPYAYFSDQRYYGPYVYWKDDELQITMEFSLVENDYHGQDWYALALPRDWDRAQKRQEDYYWMTAHTDETISPTPMLAVETPIYVGEVGSESIVGIATLDWSGRAMYEFLRNEVATTDYDILLLDTDLDHVIANTLDPESEVIEVDQIPWISSLVNPEKRVIKEVVLDINGQSYEVHYTLTNVGMLFASLLPVSVVNESVNKLDTIDIAAASFFGLLVVVLLFIALGRVTGPIIELTKAVGRVSRGETAVELKIKSNDELGLLVTGFNKMTKTLSEQKVILENRAVELEERVRERTKEVEQKNVELEVIKNSLEKNVAIRVAELETLKNNLEKNVADRTKELGTKLDELERLNKIMVDREIKMISLKKEIKELKEGRDGVDSSKSPI